MIWMILGIWWVVALGYFFVLGWLNRDAHGLMLVIAATFWPIVLPFTAVAVAIRAMARIGSHAGSSR